MKEDIYTTNTRFYSEEGLLIWKTKDTYPDVATMMVRVKRDLGMKGVFLSSVDYPEENNSHYSVYGSISVKCPEIRRCNVQVRKNGKMIPWKHLL